MLVRRVGLAVVVVAVVAVIAVKVSSPGRTSAATSTALRGPAVVLVADQREAESACGCGEIIRMVRSAADQGVAVREVLPSDLETTRAYQVTVAPTVLVLDAAGHVVERHEGEGEASVNGIKSALARLVPAHR